MTSGRSAEAERNEHPKLGNHQPPGYLRPESARPELNSGILPGNVKADDWILLFLALVSAGMLGWLLISPPARDISRWFFVVDCVICGIFFLELLWRWRKRAWRPMFLARTWYEVFAMIPVAHPDFVAHHHIIGVILLVVRLGRATDRALGEQFFYRLVDKLLEALVRAIKKPITVAVLDEVVKVLETGNYPENLAKSLNENKTELRAIISEKISTDPQLGRLRRLPFHDEIVHATVDTSFRVLLEVLLDPRIDDFFSAVVRDNREQIRRAVMLGLNEREHVPEDEDLLRTRPQRAAAREYDANHPDRR